jgi:N utilization substance protein B
MSRKRSQARLHSVQALYQWQMTGQDVSEVERQFLAERDLSGFDVGYFHDLLHGVPGQLDRLDEALGPLLDRSIASVDPVERAILRLGAYELLQHPEIPYRVVINEAVELAKTFGATEGHKYVNGVLDRMARQVREVELGARAKGGPGR